MKVLSILFVTADVLQSVVSQDTILHSENLSLESREWVRPPSARAIMMIIIPSRLFVVCKLSECYRVSSLSYQVSAVTLTGCVTIMTHYNIQIFNVTNCSD